MFPESFYVEINDKVKELIKTNEVLSSHIIDTANFFGYDTEQGFDSFSLGSDLHDHFKKYSTLLSKENFSTFLYNWKVLRDAFPKNFYVDRTLKNYHLLRSMFDILFSSGEDWDCYGGSAEYTYLGIPEDNQIIFHMKSVFSNHNCVFISNLEQFVENILHAYTFKRINSSVLTEELLPSFSKEVKNKTITKFFKF